jgi:glycosyltransferase involved in cell wall biosynthesis
MCNEASFMNSGYANYGREILKGLYKTGKYEIAELGCFATVEDARGKDLPWKFYPNAVSSKDERYQKYISNQANSFGFWRFDLTCLDFKPDIVIDVRDPWMFEYQSFSPLREFYHWVIMPPVDSIPQKTEWLNTFSSADIVIPYTQWAKNALGALEHKNLYHKIAPAGINKDVFYPIENGKEKLGIDQKAFVIGAVMRNQRRKLIPSLMELFSKVSSQTETKCLLYLHTTYPEMMGWDIPQLLIEHNIVDKVLFTYMCKKCRHFYPSVFRGAQTVCPKCKTHTSTLSSTMDGITEYELSQIYNTFDVLLQYAICEGFGMPQIEAGACGVPVCSVDYTAMSEVVRNIGGYPIPVNQVFYELESSAYRAYPNMDAAKETLLNLINMNSIERDELRRSIRNKTVRHYSWEASINTWIEAIDSLNVDNKRPWSDKQRFIIPQVVDLDYSLSAFDLSKYICNNIIHSDSLLYSEFCQKAIRDLDLGVSKSSNGFSTFTKEMLVKNLEQYANHKVFIDDIRLSNNAIMEDFIEYARS